MNQLIQRKRSENMKAEDIKRLYDITPKLHESIVDTLQQLDDASVEHYQKRKTVRRSIIIFAVIASIVAFSTVAYATNLFGLLTEPVGKYGLDMHVVRESTPDTAENPKHVRLKLGYIPEGYEQIKDENGFVEPNKYSYGGKSITDRWGFTFLIYTGADSYSRTETYIVESRETIVNGHKIIYMTQQFEDNGDKQYLAAEYFDNWDTVVVGYCGNKDELVKIMEHLDLEEDTDYVESEPETFDPNYDPYAGYEFSMIDETREYQLGETFTWSRQIVDAPSPAYCFKEGECEITVKSVKENDGIIGLDRNNLLAPDDAEWYSRYFNNDGSLKTPYIRTELENGDGIDSLGHYGSQEVNRHFYLVAVEVKNGSFNGQFMTNVGGAIYQEQHHENAADIYTVGIIVDEDELDDLVLSITSTETIIDDETQTAIRKNIDTVIPLLTDQ